MTDQERAQRLHTSVSLMEAACLILERVTVDGAVELHPKVKRWCKQIRNEQQKQVRRLDKT